MANVPYESSDIERFTPACLADSENPPVFRLKAASRRERKRYEQMLGDEGLRFHDQETIRAEMINGLQQLWSPEHFEHYEPLLREYWQAKDEWRDANGERSAEEAEPFVFTAFSEEDIKELVGRLTESWSPLRRLAAQNAMFLRESPKIIISILLSGWSSLDTPFVREEGRIPLDTVDDIADALLEVEAKATGIAAGLAFSELALACSSRLFLTRQAEKNSSSPPPSSTPPPATNNGAESSSGTSKVSASSIETPET